jgi:hypothetical protein
MKNFINYSVCIVCFICQVSCISDRNKENDANRWQEDFFYQSLANRPQLEIAYTDSSRTAFEIVAQDYHLTGQLQAPHLLVDKKDAQPWLWIEMEDSKGVRYSTKNNKKDTRINLYRRCPYYCEIH